MPSNFENVWSLHLARIIRIICVMNQVEMPNATSQSAIISQI